MAISNPVAAGTSDAMRGEAFVAGGAGLSHPIGRPAVIATKKNAKIAEGLPLLD